MKIESVTIDGVQYESAKMTFRKIGVKDVYERSSMLMPPYIQINKEQYEKIFKMTSKPVSDFIKNQDGELFTFVHSGDQFSLAKIKIK